jgi:S1-C subfamily serine protease
VIVVAAALALALALALAGDGRSQPVRPYPRTWQPAAVLSPERAAAVVVRVEGRGGGRFDFGTGVGIAPNLVLTADHLLDERSLFTIRCDVAPVEVRTVARDHAHDVAIITVAGQPLVSVELAAADPPPGTPVVVSGYPQGQQLLVVPGRVESYVDGHYVDATGTVMRFSPPPAPGQSGGALLDAHGRLVGIVTGVEKAAGIGYAVPVSVLRTVVAALAPPLVNGPASSARPREPACPAGS